MGDLLRQCFTVRWTYYDDQYVLVVCRRQTDEEILHQPLGRDFSPSTEPDKWFSDLLTRGAEILRTFRALGDD